MATIARLAVQIGANTSKLERGLQSARKKVQNFGRSVQQAGTKLTLGLTVPILGAGAKMASLAMDAEETADKFRISFGDMSDDASKFANEFSSSMGLYKADIQEQMSSYYNLANAMGIAGKESMGLSKDLTKFTQDFASMQNLDTEQAFTKVMSAMSGSVEPLRRYGIVISQANIKNWAYTHGLAKQGEELTEQQKVMARYNLIMEQGDYMLGNLAETADSTTNRLRRFKNLAKTAGTTLGDILLPYINSALGYLNDMLKAFMDLNPEIQENIIKWLGIVAVLGPALKIFGLLLGLVSKLMSPLGLLATAIGIVVGATIGWKEAFKKIWETIKTVGEAISLFIDGMPYQAMGKLSELIAGIFGEETQSKIFVSMFMIYQKVKEIFSLIKGVVVTISTGIREFWAENGEMILAKTSSVFGFIFEVISGLMVMTYGVIKSTWETIHSFWVNIGSVIFEAIAGVMGEIFNIISVIWDTVYSLWETYGESIFDSTNEYFTSIYETIGTLLETAFGVISSIWEGIKTLWNDYGKSIWGATKFFFGEIFSTVGEIINSIKEFISRDWGIIKDFWNTTGRDIWETTKTIFGWIAGLIGSVLGSIVEGIRNNWDSIKQIFSTAMNIISGTVDLFLNLLSGNWKGAWENIKSITSNFWGENGLLAGVVQLGLSAIRNIVNTVLNVVGEIFGITFDGVKTKIEEVFNGVWTFIKEIWGDITGFISEKVGWIVGKVEKVQRLISKITRARNNIPSVSGGSIGSAVAMAKGGVVTKPTLAMIGEAGEDEAVIPLSRLGEFGSGGKQITQVILDGEVIAEQVDRKQGTKVLRMRGAI